MSANYFYTSFKEVSLIHNVNTRQSCNHNLAIKKCNTEYYKNSICYRGAMLWNDLPIKIKQSTSLEAFKTSLRQYLFNRALTEL